MAGKRISMVLLAVLAGIVSAAEYPFSDNFSNAATSYLNWSQIPADSVSRTVTNGAYTVVNRKKNGTAIVYHAFVNKVSTYTASAVITRTADSIEAGLWLSLIFPQVSGRSIAGYVVRLHSNNTISVFKNSDSGAGHLIFQSDYNRRNLTDTVMVSKKDDKLNIFVNGTYLGAARDNAGSPLVGGDFGLIVPQNTTVSFDDVTFTDQYTAGSSLICITDKFDDRTIASNWIQNNGMVLGENSDSMLSLYVRKDSMALVYTPMERDTFAARLVTSWRSGDSVPLYGFYVAEKNASDSMRIAMFGISGEHKCATFRIGGTYSPKAFTGNIIRGKAFVMPETTDTVFWKDTIDVFKNSGASHYVMYVNGNRLDSLPVLAGGFSITQAGIFCSNGEEQVVAADEFHVGPTLDECSTSPVVWKPSRMVPSTAVLPIADDRVFDLLGRKMLRGAPRTIRPVTGIYVSPGDRRKIEIK